MNSKERNLDILSHIVKYCDEIAETHGHFDRSYDVFKTNSIYRNAISMCLLQIGELAGNLSDDFKAAYSGVPWQSIRGMRNFVAHKYGQVDIEVLWATSNEKVVELLNYCTDILKKQSNTEL
jgi:uncharacterized protein with HEPN domain